MPVFEQLEDTNDLKEILKSAFDADIPLLGSWGYTQESATIIASTDTTLEQLEHMFASMRAYLEMNMTLEKDARYGSINLNELSREEYALDSKKYQKVIYTITAMKESLYSDFIKEYKEGYGKEGFDLNLHFQKRKEATLHREAIHWFQLD